MTTTKERAAFIKASKAITIEPLDLHPDPANPHKYSELMDAQYRAFMQQYVGEGSDSSGIHHGFFVVGRILQQAPLAYANLLIQTNQQTSDASELGRLLCDNYESAVVPLAQTSNRANKTLETWYGITGDNPIGENPVYQFTVTEHGITFEPHLTNRTEAILDLARRTLSGDLEEVGPKDRCPALAYVLPKLWGTMATFCATRSAYFETDIHTRINTAVLSAVSE